VNTPGGWRIGEMKKKYIIVAIVVIEITAYAEENKKV
jgi:hypothetical protein